MNPAPIRSISSNSITRKHQCHRCRYQISVIRCSSSNSPDQPATNSVDSDVFGGKKELRGLQSLVDAMSPPVRLASSVLTFAGALAAGSGLGFRFGESRNAALGPWCRWCWCWCWCCIRLNSCVPEVTVVNLHNYVVGCDDPGRLRKEDIEGIANKYGVSKQNEAFNAELCDLYCRFVSSVLPFGSEDLKGNEVETIIRFKNALGIDDSDAAAMHMELGR